MQIKRPSFRKNSCCKVAKKCIKCFGKNVPKNMARTPVYKLHTLKGFQILQNSILRLSRRHRILLSLKLLPYMDFCDCLYI